MLKKLAIGTIAALAGAMMVAETAMAAPPPPPGWGGPPPPPWLRRRPPPPRWGGPGWGIYIVPPFVRRYPPRYCNVPACSATYRSFRAWDCTYQPFYGPRRYCDIP